MKINCDIVTITKLSPQAVPSRTNPIPGISDPSTLPVVALANQNNWFNIITYCVSKCEISDSVKK